MKKIILLSLLCALIVSALSAQVAINPNGAAPAASAMLDISSSAKGMLMPRMSSSQRKGIASPDPGLLVYDTDRQTPYLFDGSKWRPLIFGEEGQLPLVEREVPGMHHQGKMGFVVSIWGDHAMACAAQDSSSGVANTGTVQLFSRTSGNWKHTGRLIPPIVKSGGAFGEALAMEGDFAVVGQHLADKPGKINAGAVYVYKRSGDAWSLFQTLTPSQDQAGAAFGCAVSIQNGRIAVGAYGQSLNGNANVGAVYVFKWNGSSFVEEKYIPSTQTSPHTWFGTAVAIHGNRLLVGATGGKTGQVISGVAVAYTFVALTNQWTYAGTLYPSQVQHQMNFGANVALRDNRAVVAATGYGYNQEDGNGLVESFQSGVNGWTSTGYVHGPEGLNLGISLAILDDGFLAGTYSDYVGRVFRYNSSGKLIFTFRDNLFLEKERSWFGFSVAAHDGQIIIGLPSKAGIQQGRVQFGVLD